MSQYAEDRTIISAILLPCHGPFLAECMHTASGQKAAARRRRKAEKVRLAKPLADFKKTPGDPLKEDLCISLTYGFWKNYIAPWDHRSAFRLS